jgi:argininosuccinate synthase
MKTRILLAYAGEADVSWAVRRLSEVDGAEVVTLTLDLGQGRDLEELRDRALTAGAVRAHVLDVREEFARDFVLPALQAGVSQTGPGLLAMALGQPLLARKLVEISAIEAVTSIAHVEAGEDRKRLERCLAALDGKARFIVMADEAGPSERLPANLWGRVRVATTSSAKTLDTPASVEISFDRGVATAVNGVSMALAELIESLTTIGGRHGVGRIALADQAVQGGPDASRSSRVYEAPAAVILHAAHRALETAVVPSELTRIQRDQAVTYAELVYEGRWFTDARKVLDDFSAAVQPMVTGAVCVKLFAGELLSACPVERPFAAVSHS